MPTVEEMVAALAACGAPIEDISEETRLSIETLRERFGDVIETGRARTRNRLRTMQIQVALNGNVPMLIHLGKSMLGQVVRDDGNGNELPPSESDASRELLNRLTAIAERKQLRAAAEGEVVVEQVVEVEVRELDARIDR